MFLILGHRWNCHLPANLGYSQYFGHYDWFPNYVLILQFCFGKAIFFMHYLQSLSLDLEAFCTAIHFHLSAPLLMTLMTYSPQWALGEFPIGRFHFFQWVNLLRFQFLILDLRLHLYMCSISHSQVPVNPIMINGIALTSILFT